jgi:hypothetical protein
MTATGAQWDGQRADELTLDYEELRSAVGGRWDGRSSLHGLGTFMRAGMAAWICQRLDAGRRANQLVPVRGHRWDAKALPMSFCGEVVGVLAGMALAAAAAESQP